MKIKYKDSSINIFTKNLVIFFTSLMVILISAEIIVRVFWPMDTGEVWRMHAPHGQSYAVNIPNAKVEHRFRQHFTTYTLNSLGNRGGEPGQESIQVAFLGDSFTFGLFVDEKDTAVGLIRARALNTYGPGKVGFQNAAIAASGIADWIAFLSDYGQRLKPDVVLVYLNYVSISRGYKHPLFNLDCETKALVRASPPKIDISVEWPKYQKYEDRTLTLWLIIKRWFNDHSQVFMVARKGYQELIQLTYSVRALKATTPSASPEVLPNMPSSQQVIDQENLHCFVHSAFKELKAAVGHAGGHLVVVDIGYRWQTTMPKDISIDLVALDFVPKVLNKLQVPYLDLTKEVFRAHEQGQIVSIIGDGHPTKFGYQIVANETWPFLRQQIDALGVKGK